MKQVRFQERQLLPIGLGTWHMGEHYHQRPQELQALQTGLEQGITAIDTAEMYGEGNAEILVGEAIQPFARQQLYLISKVYPWNASKQQLPRSLDRSLQRLGTDYLDLYLLHWPGSVPLAETVAAMEAAVAAGKIKHWGVSNFDTPELAELWQEANGSHCITNQVLYNLGTRGIEFDLLPWMRQRQLPLIAYSPVAQGDSLGHDFTGTAILQELAASYQVTIFQLLLAWGIRDGHTLAIPQSRSPQHVLDNIAATQLNLTPQDLALLDGAFPPPTTKEPLAVL